MLTNIANFLIELRCLPTEGAPASGRSPHALDADVRKCLAQLTEGDRRDDLIEIWNEMMTMPPWDGTGAVWMHGDVAPGNLLFRDKRLVAAIDWSELGVGDPASDLQVAWNMLGPDARQILRESMQVKMLYPGAGTTRALAHSFQLPYYRDSLPALAAQAQWVFGEILAEYGK
ncbi:MAG: phosphotransferase [Thermomicrobiales bacterium]|nr:phosphotransferase [Thermomicrobiales bacterium]